MTENKTQPSDESVTAFIDAVDHAGRRAEGHVLDDMFRKVTGVAPQMWGPSIIGYGRYHYRTRSGHEGDMCRVGFSPRKAKHTLYLLGCGEEDAAMAGLLARLGKHSRGKGCLYINKLADIDLAVLEQMIRTSWNRMNAKFPQ